jgi:hypothetical protein
MARPFSFCLSIRITITIALACVAAPAVAQTATIQGFVSCVEFLPSNYVRAHFGYVSTYPINMPLPVGFHNYFTPAPQNQGQPTLFEPGFHDKVFSLMWQVDASHMAYTWNIMSRPQTAARDPRLLCGVRSRGDWDANATYVEADLVRYNGELFVNYDAAGACPGPPADNACWIHYTPSPPVISELYDLTTLENYAIKNVPFTVSDVDNIWNLTILASSSDTTLLPLNGILFDGYGENRTLTVIPAPNRSGSAVITVFVTDGVSVATDSFIVIVLPSSAGVDPGVD